MNRLPRIPSPSPGRILIRGLNWLGDAVMSTPALMRLREKYPRAHVALLTSEKLASLWQHHPLLDQLFVFSPQDRVWQIGRRLRVGRFDTALILPNSFRAALETWWARIPRRIGFAVSWRSGLLTDAVARRPETRAMHKRSRREIQHLISGVAEVSPPAIPSGAHHLHHYLDLVGVLGADVSPLPPQMPVPEEEMRDVGQRLGLAARPDSPWFALNAGAEYGPAKRWPPDRFVAAAVQLHQLTRCRWVILGGSRDRELAREITGQIRAALTAAGTLASPRPNEWALDLAGTTTLRELCAVLKICRLLLTNDTGPMHVAAAVGTPVVVPFGSTSPELTGPGLPHDPRHRFIRSAAPCSPCFRRHCPIDFRCMTSIQVGQVVQAACDILGPH
jgi:heptosyltransferase-2